MGFPGGSIVKNLPANAGDRGSIPGSGSSPGTPGSPAFEKKEEREHAKEVRRREREGLPTLEEEELAKAQEEIASRSQRGFQRQQPVRRKSKKKCK